MNQQEGNVTQYSKSPQLEDLQLPESAIIMKGVNDSNFVSEISKDQNDPTLAIKEKKQYFTSRKYEANTQSKQRLKNLEMEQAYLSDTFKIDNFYQHQKLNISNLKNKLNQMKPRKIVSDFKHDNQEYIINTSNDAQFKSTQLSVRNNTRNRYRNSNKQTLIPLNKKILIQKDKGNANDFYNIPSQRAKYCSTTFQKTSTGSANSKKEAVDKIRAYDLSVNKGRKTGMDMMTIPYNPQINRKKNRQSNYKEDATRSTIIPKIQSIGHRQKQHNSIIEAPKFKENSNRYLAKFGNTNTDGSPKSQGSADINSFINSRLQPIIKKNITKLQIYSSQGLQQFETNINELWALYELLTQIVNSLSASQAHIAKGRNNIQRQLTLPKFINQLVDYKSAVCSTRFEFIMPVLEHCMQQKHAKVILQSKLLENLSIVYIFFHIADSILLGEDQEKKSNKKIELVHLVNFVGICSSNIILILRLLTLTHNISSSFALSQKTTGIFQAIRKFEVESFFGELTSFNDVSLRIEHNNSLAVMIQNKLNYRLKDKDLHTKCINGFLRGVVIDGLRSYYKHTSTKNGQYQAPQASNIYKPLFEYSFYIFQYLSYHLHNQNYIGLFPAEIETAPQPYLPLTNIPTQANRIKQFTIVINAKGVLVHQSIKYNKIFIRAHSQYFLKELAKKCNIVFWSDEMPCQIDSYFDLLEIPAEDDQQKIKLYRLYRHHCLYGINSQEMQKANGRRRKQEKMQTTMTMIKDINRIPLPTSKYLILDHNFDNYYEEELDYCLNLSWKGEPSDYGLKILVDYLRPLLREGIDLGVGVSLMKARLEASLKEARTSKSKHKKQHHHRK